MRLQQLIPICLIIVILLTPTALTAGMVWYYTGASINDLVPFLSDEILYWHQSATFSTAGFNGGYYSEYELIAAADFSHYYAWGPFIPMIYGTFGAIFGWHLNSIVWINLFLFTLSLGVFIALVRPTTEQLILLLALTVTFVPFWLFSHRSLIEVMNQSFAIFLAAFYARLLKQQFSWWMLVPFALVMLLAASVRVTWLLALLPFFVLMARGRHWSLILAAPVITLVILYPTLSFVGYVAAPFEDFLTRLFIVMESSTADGMAFLMEHLSRNWWAGIYGLVPERGIFLQYLVLSVYFGGVLIVAMVRRGKLADDAVWEGWFHVANLPVIFVGIYLAYDTFDWRGMRTLSPHLLMSLMMMVAMRRRWLVWSVVAISLMVTPATLVVYRDWVGQHVITPEEQEEVAQTHRDFAQLLTFDPQAESAWCNTIVYDPTILFYNAPSVALSLPAGMGLSGAGNGDELFYESHHTDSYQLKSKYVALLDDNARISEALAPLTLLGKAGGLTFYENSASLCPSTVSQEN